MVYYYLSQILLISDVILLGTTITLAYLLDKETRENNIARASANRWKTHALRVKNKK